MPTNQRPNANVLSASGADIPVTLHKDNLFEQCYPLIGSGCDMIELLFVPNDELVLLVDEDGLRHNPTYNFRASELAGQDIVGNAVVVNRSMVV